MVHGERLGERSIALEFVCWRENTALQLVCLETVLGLQFLCVRNKMADGPDLSFPIPRIWIAKEQVRRERNSIPQAAAQNFRNGSSPGLPEEIQAGEFERCEYLNGLAVKRASAIADAEP